MDMPFELRADAALAPELRRVAGDQATAALASLRAGRAQPPDEVDTTAEDAWDAAIHDARKRAKKVRAAARLCRDAVGGAAYRRLNVAFRDAARLLAEARDAWTLVETADLLAAEDEEDLLPDDVAAALRDALLDRYLALRRREVHADLLGRAHAAYDAAAALLPGWPLPEDLGGRDLEPSLARTCRRGREGWEAARASADEDPDATTERWHEWRKRIKYRWYHTRLLAPAWPAVLGPEADALDELADALGTDHDHGVLLAAVAAEDLIPAAQQAVVAGASAAQRHRLRGRALPLAARLHAEEPDAIAARLAGIAALTWP